MVEFVLRVMSAYGFGSEKNPKPGMVPCVQHMFEISKTKLPAMRESDEFHTKAS